MKKLMNHFAYDQEMDITSNGFHIGLGKQFKLIKAINISNGKQKKFQKLEFYNLMEQYKVDFNSWLIKSSLSC